jgi:uncharacterized protein YccT (UPF0319 family)
MKIRSLLLIALNISLVTACSATGPVKFYSGTTPPRDQLAIVTVPAPITVLSIDGKEVDAPSQEEGTYEVQLEPGPHFIAFRYELYWGTNEHGMLIKSPQVAVDTNFIAGHSYELRYKVPGDADEAENYLTKFEANLVDRDNGQQYASYPAKDINQIIASRKLHPPQPSTSTAMSADAVMKQDPIKRLKFWWLMANEQERKQFTDWMKTATESFAPEASKPAQPVQEIKIKP